MKLQKSALAALPFFVAALLTGTAHAQAPDVADSSSGPWPSLASEVFHDKPIQDGNGVIALDAPVRAEDAALVPIKLTITLPEGDARKVRKITLVIDENPAPVAAVFSLGEKADVRSIATRVRVNQYTNVHAVAELSDGALYGVARYVKAAGGCSAPAIKNLDEANASLGQMKFREVAEKDDTSKNLKEAIFMMRHPNNSGLQMDQVTHLYIPARYVGALKIAQGDDLILSVDGGISISEDPNIRFTFKPSGAHEITVDAKDTNGVAFHGEWAISPTM